MKRLLLVIVIMLLYVNILLANFVISAEPGILGHKTMYLGYKIVCVEPYFGMKFYHGDVSIDYHYEDWSSTETVVKYLNIEEDYNINGDLSLYIPEIGLKCDVYKKEKVKLKVFASYWGIIPKSNWEVRYHYINYDSLGNIEYEEDTVYDASNISDTLDYSISGFGFTFGIEAEYSFNNYLSMSWLYGLNFYHLNSKIYYGDEYISSTSYYYDNDIYNGEISALLGITDLRLQINLNF